MIPKIIHQIWIGDQKKRPAKLIESWINKNPTWNHILWTENNIYKTINSVQYESADELPGKADILRYSLLYQFGGVFVDADSECVNGFDDYFVDNDSFCCWENEYVRQGLMSNGYLGATRKNTLMGLLVEEVSKMKPEILKNMESITAWKTTGPVLLSNTVNKYIYNKIKIYPSHYFIPNHYTNLNTYFADEKNYAKQYWGSTKTINGKVGMQYEYN